VLAGSLLAALASAAPAAAAPPADDEARKLEARRLVEEARARFDAGDPAGALAKFEAAMAVRPSTKLHYNLGVCHQRLADAARARGDAGADARHTAAAVDAFNAYLRAHPDAPDRVAVEDTVRTLGGTPATAPKLRDPLTPAADPQPRDPPTPADSPAPEPRDPPTPAVAPAAPPEPPPPRGYLGALLGFVSQPQLVDRGLLDGAVQGLLVVRGGGRLGARRRVELGGQVWLAVPGQTSAMHLALSSQSLLVDVAYAVPLGSRRRFELPLGGAVGVMREALRVRPGQPLPACADGGADTLVSARAGGVVGGRLGFAVLVGPRRNHEIGMHVHLAFIGLGRGTAGGSCDRPPPVAAELPRARLVITSAVGYAFRF
jgi:hypothetical protein